MRILLIGATGTIGKAIAAALGRRHEILLASRQRAPLHVDIADPASIRGLYAKAGKVGAVISAAGDARFKPLDELSDADFRFSLDNKLMGQVNVVRYGLGSVADSGSSGRRMTLSSSFRSSVNICACSRPRVTAT